jgi:hypothetical protein
MRVAGAADGSQRERQCVVVLGPAVEIKIRFGAHARRARNHVRVAVRNDCNIPFREPDWLEFGIAHERYPARTAGDDVILHDILSAWRDLVSNLRGRWRF